LFTDRFLIGVDLAWKRGKSSFFVVVSEDLKVLYASTFYEYADFFTEIKGFQGILNVFVDAPLCVEKNLKFRSCDKLFLKARIPILPVNESIIKTKYSPFSALSFREFLESRGFKYCGSFDENSFFEVYAFGNAALTFGFKNKREFLKSWREAFQSLGFYNLDMIKSHHHIDALACVLPYFMEKWEFPVFKLLKEGEYCIFIPGE
jgi:predicted nuclease with RNAse H fold